MFKCEGCGGKLVFDPKTQKLKCEQCGTKYVIDASMKTEDVTYNTFQCPSCGGQIYGTDYTISGFCSFCGSPVTFSCSKRNGEIPEGIIPFTVTKEKCRNIFLKQVKSVPFMPKEYQDETKIESFRGIYIPYWRYEIQQDCDFDYKVVETYSRGDTSHTVGHQISGHVNSIDDSYVHDASLLYTDDLSEHIAIKSSEKEIREFNPAYLSGFYADNADIDCRTYEQRAKEKAEVNTTRAIGNCINSKASHSYFVDTDKKDKYNGTLLGVKTFLQPIWFMSYRNKDRVAYATINGRTGDYSIDFPVDVRKACSYVILIAAVIALVLSVLPFILTPKFLTIVSSIMLSITFTSYHFQTKAIMYRNLKIHNQNDSSNQEIKIGKKKVNMEVVYVAGLVFTFVLLIFNLKWFNTGTMSIIGYSLGSFFSLFYILWYGIQDFLVHKINIGKVVTCVNILAAICIFIFEIMNPVDDILYYVENVSIIGLSAFNMLSCINRYNKIVMSEMPQFAAYKGGRNHAYTE